MLGAITGDVIGAPFEIANHRGTDFELFSRGSTFTDDTVMTVAVADALLHGRDHAENMRRWFAHYPKAGYGHMFRAWAADPGMGPYGSFGNGSAMRVSPVAWAFETEPEVLAAARATAEVSHDHPEGVKGAEAIALATFLARRGVEKTELLARVAVHTGYDLGFTLDAIRWEYVFDATCQGSVPQALVAVREGEDFESTIRRAISIGGDSDTIAAMAGAVAEALYGVPEAIETEVRKRLDTRLGGVLDLFRERYGMAG